MKLLIFSLLLITKLTVLSQCSETPGLAAIGGNCLGTASLNITGATNVAGIKWSKNNELLYDFGPVYSFNNTMAGGGQGNAANQLRYPNGVCMDKNGYLYVADKDNHRVQRFAPGEWNAVTVAGGNGQGGGLNQLNYPTGVKVDANGNIFISDNNNHRIVKWLPGAVSGTVVAGGNGQGAGLNQLNYPGGLDLDANGNIYVADNSNHRIVKWAPGTLNGTVVAGGNGQGSNSNQLNYPHGVAVDTAGNVYIADDNPKVQKWAPGAVTGVMVAGTGIAGGNLNELNAVSSVFIDRRGYLIIGDGNNDRVQSWAPGAVIGNTVAGGNGRGDGANQLAYPSGVFSDTAGNIIVCDILNHRIQKWSPNISKTLAAVDITSPGVYKAAVITFNGCNYTTGNVNIFPTGTLSAGINYSNYFKASCQDYPASFVASVANKDLLSPAFQWYKNRTPINGSTDSLFTSNSLVNGDTISCRIITTSNGCLSNDTVFTPVKIFYRKPEYIFNGNGNWNNPANWLNGKIPPSDLACCSKITINPAGTGECVVNVPVTIPACVDLNMLAGKKLRVLGNFVNRYDSTIVLKNNVYVVADNGMTLISTPSELTQGIYKFTMGSFVPQFQPGDVLVGGDSLGYVRIISSFTNAGNTMTFQTTAGTINDVFKQGVFSSVAKTDSTLGSRPASPLADGFTYNFGNEVLYQNGPVTITLTNGSITLNPNWVFDFNFQNGSLNYFKAGFQNASYNANFTVNANASQSVSLISGEKSLYSVSKPYTKIVPVYGIPVPVIIMMKLDFIAKYSFNVSAAISQSVTYTNNGPVSLGLNYVNGNWQPDYSQNCVQSTSVSNPSGTVTATVNVDVVPTFSFRIYNLAGPYAGLGVGTSTQVSVGSPSLDWDLMSGIFLKAIAGVSADAFGNNLFDYSKEWTSDTLKYLTPFKLEKVSGDNQTGQPNQYLTQPVRVQVKDNKNSPSRDVRVYFTVTGGNGSVLNPDGVLTSMAGFAETQWRIGSGQGIQTLQAIARKADGTPLQNAPLEFTASVEALPEVSSNNVYNITDTTATSGGTITYAGLYPVTARGVCWDTLQNPTINNAKTLDGAGTGSFVSDIRNLTPNTTYYMRAYATNASGTGYGEERTFTTTGGCTGSYDSIYTDPRDGQQYPYKQIGTQVWMIKNLNYAAPGSWCNGDNAANCATYGRLYDWNTALTVAPPGWHLPSDAEWTTLTNFLGGESVAGGKMKSTCSLWLSPNTGATNSSGWSGLPGGYRHTNGPINPVGSYGNWWSSTEYSTDYAWHRGLNYNYGDAYMGYANKTNGFSVRCLRD